MTFKINYTIAIIIALLSAGSEIYFMVRAPRWLLKTFQPMRSRIKTNRNLCTQLIFPGL